MSSFNAAMMLQQAIAGISQIPGFKEQLAAQLGQGQGQLPPMQQAVAGMGAGAAPAPEAAMPTAPGVPDMQQAIAMAAPDPATASPAPTPEPPPYEADVQGAPSMQQAIAMAIPKTGVAASGPAASSVPGGGMQSMQSAIAGAPMDASNDATPEMMSGWKGEMEAGPLERANLERLARAGDRVHGVKAHLMGMLKGFGLGGLGGMLYGGIDPNGVNRTLAKQRGESPNDAANAERQMREDQNKRRLGIEARTGYDPTTGKRTFGAEQKDLAMDAKRQQLELAYEKLKWTQENGADKALIALEAAKYRKLKDEYDRERAGRRDTAADAQTAINNKRNAANDIEARRRASVAEAGGREGRALQQRQLDQSEVANLYRIAENSVGPAPVKKPYAPSNLLASDEDNKTEETAHGAAHEKAVADRAKAIEAKYGELAGKAAAGRAPAPSAAGGGGFTPLRKGMTVTTGGKYELPDGRKIRVKTFNAQTNQITDYDVIQ